MEGQYSNDFLSSFSDSKIDLGIDHSWPPIAFESNFEHMSDFRDCLD